MKTDNRTRLEQLSIINKLAYVLQKETKLIVTTVFNGKADTFKIIIKNNNGERIYTHLVEFVKSDQIVSYELGLITGMLYRLRDNNGERI